MSAPELFNWVVEVTVGAASVLLWVTGCSTADEATTKGLTQVEEFLDADLGHKPAVNGLPVNMGAD